MDKKKQEMIMAIAKEYGFDTFERIPDWKGYEVYSPYNKNGKKIGRASCRERV